MSRLCHDRAIRPVIYDLLPTEGDSGVDLGAGMGEFGLLTRARNQGMTRFTAVDIWKPYCDFLSKMKIYDTVVCMDVCKYMESLRVKQDFGICTEVLEHIKRKPYDSGARLIDNIYHKCEKAIIATPLDWVPVEAGFDGNPASEHVSRYTVRDFTDRGFKVRLIDQTSLPRQLRTPYRILARLAGKYVYRHIVATKGF